MIGCEHQTDLVRYAESISLFAACACGFGRFSHFDVGCYTNYNYYKNIVKARGIDNYVYVVNDPDFWLAMKNTFIFVLGTVPLTIAIALLIALMLNAVGKGKTFFRTIYFLPFVSSMVAVSIVWRWIFHHDYGLMNYLLSLIGVSPVNWLNDPHWAMPSLILLSVWKGLGYNVVLFLAGLQNINQQYIHAARIDGASKWNRFLHITVPLLSPTTFFITIISIIASFKVFDEIFSLFGGPGPAQSALTIVFYIYRKFNAFGVQPRLHVRTANEFCGCSLKMLPYLLKQGIRMLD